MSRWFLQCTDNFLTQVVEKLMRGMLLGLVFTNKEGLVKDAMTGESSGCRDPQDGGVQDLAWKKRSKAIGRIATLDFK